jgi:hypoxanthine-guanine phosphoribosyltransferase
MLEGTLGHAPYRAGDVIIVEDIVDTGLTLILSARHFTVRERATRRLCATALPD